VESLEFIGILVVGAIVAGWYFQNAEKGANGEFGILAVKPDRPAAPEEKTPRYRIKPRRAIRARDLRSVESAKAAEEAAPAYRVRTEAASMRRRFRRQDEARYRIKDKVTGEFVRPDADT